MKKRIFAILLALTLALSLLPTAVFATGEDAPAEPQQEQQEEANPEQPEAKQEEQQPEESPAQPEQPEQQPEVKPAEEEKEAQKEQEAAPQPAQPEGEPVVLNDEIETPAAAAEVSTAEELIAAVSTGGNIKMMDDITINGELTIKDPVMLDLNNYELKATRIEINSEFTATGGTINDWVDITSAGGVIKGGTFSGTVVNYNVISGGTFRGTVGNCNLISSNPTSGMPQARITGGDFYGEVTNGPVNEGNVSGTIIGGSFYGKVTNTGFGMISGGSFYDEVVNNAQRNFLNGIPYGCITGGTFYGKLTDNSTGGYSVQTCTVTYTSFGSEYARQVVVKGQAVTAPLKAPTKDYYQFVEWRTADGTAYDFNTAVTGDITLTAQWSTGLTGSGTEDDPYQIGTAIGLKWFRDKVNDASSIDETKICAELTADIVLDATENWEPIGKDLNAMAAGTFPYTGTFDGKGHTIKNLNVNSETFAGLFGYVRGGTIRNLTVSGSVNGQQHAGGIAGAADGGTFENCANLCAVQGGIAGGIIGYVNNGECDLIVRDCYNVGYITTSTDNSVGGIIGQCTGTQYSTISNCYNAGKVTGSGGVGAIVGNDGTKTISNCYYLVGSAIRAVNGDKASIAKSAADLADGTVLALLINDRESSPWDSVSKEWNGMVLPGFTWQNNNHTHNWGAWTSNGDGTHSRACACGVTETAKCSGGKASCTEKAICTACGEKYGNATGHDWVDATCTTPKTCKVCKLTEGNALGHKGGKATCHTKAKCEVCNDAYGEFDAANHDGGTEIKDAKDATCTEKGYTGDTYCKGCNEKLTNGKDIPALDHDWGKWTANDDGTHTRVCSRDKSHTETNNCSGGTADCCHKAECKVCGGKYGSLDPDNHSDLKHFPAKRATTRAEGNIEYWYCSGCGKYYKDAEATKEITQKDTMIRKRRPSGDSTATGDKTVKSVKTGDAGIALYVGMAALSLTGGAWLRRKTK